MTLPIEPWPLSIKATMRSTRFRSESMFCSVPWLARTTSWISGWSRAASVSPSSAGGPFADELSTSTKVSPRIPAVLNRVTESLRRSNLYLVLTFIMTSTGVVGLPLTMRMPVTLPMSTPAKRTGAPSRRPPALSKYDRRLILWVSHPPVPLITKIRTAKVMLANTTVSPTRSCDHFSCFWLGKVVRKRQNIIANVAEFQGSRFLRVEKSQAGDKNDGSHSVASGVKLGAGLVFTWCLGRGFSAPQDCASVQLLPVFVLSSAPAFPACWA